MVAKWQDWEAKTSSNRQRWGINRKDKLYTGETYAKNNENMVKALAQFEHMESVGLASVQVAEYWNELTLPDVCLVHVANYSTDKNTGSREGASIQNDPG